MEWPSDLETVPEIDVETRSAVGEVHRTTIWAVVDGVDVYVRSLRGSAGRWYQELTAAPDTVIHVAGEAVPIHAVLAPDVESIGLWEGKPYVILSLRTGELAAWSIADDGVHSLPLS